MEIKIDIRRKRRLDVIDGRQQQDPEGTPYYSNVWATPTELYGEELYQALNVKLTETIVFKVRYCQKIAAMRGNLKDFFVVEKATDFRYRIYSINFMGNTKTWVLLKCSRVT